jgi:quinol monooxygenase YgiN
MQNMVMTILEATVDEDQWQTLRDVYARETKVLDPGIVQTLLVQNSREPKLWRIITLWESRAALDEMRQSNQTPRGVLMFREANAEPSLTIFHVAASAQA